MKFRTLSVFIAAFLFLIVIGCSNSASGGKGGKVNNYNVNLSGITLSSGTLAPGFAEDIIDYTADVINTVDSITVTPTLSDTSSTVSVNTASVASGTASAAIPLVVGDTTITIVVTASDGLTKKTYTVVVNRAGAELNSNSDLANLEISQGTLSPTFSVDEHLYTVDVPYTVASVTVKPTVAGVNAAVKVNTVPVVSGNVSGLINLAFGSNEINVLVKAENGAESTYTIRVTRAEAPVLNANAKLAGLTLSTGSDLAPVFNENKISYTARVISSIESITVTPTVAGVNASVKVNDTTVASASASDAIALEIGNNTVTILVTAESGTEKTYTIAVERISAIPDFYLDMKISDANMYMSIFGEGNAPGQYNTAAYTALGNAAAAAQTVYDNPGKTQAEIDTAWLLLDTLINSRNPDRGNLESELTDAQTMIDAIVVGNGVGEVLLSEKNALIDAAASAQAVLDDSTAIQSEIDTAWNNLSNARNILKNIRDLSIMIHDAQALCDSKAAGTGVGEVPSASKNALLSSISDAQAVSSNPVKNKDDVNAALNNLNNAQNLFNQSVYADTASLAAAVTDAQGLLDSTPVGNSSVGQVSAAAHDTFVTAIAAANYLITTGGNQTQINAGITALATAKTSFVSAILDDLAFMVNYARTGTASATGTAPGYNVTGLNDGIIVPNWNTSSTSDTFQIDLGSLKTIKRIKFYPDTNGSGTVHLKIEGSTDNLTWTTIVEDAASSSVTGNTSLFYKSALLSVSYRYVRGTCITWYGWFSVEEFQIFGD